jgi:phosphate transport system substrate-binding protein
MARLSGVFFVGTGLARERRLSSQSTGMPIAQDLDFSPLRHIHGGCMQRFTLTLVSLLLLAAPSAAAEMSYGGSLTIGAGILQTGAAAAFAENSGIRFAAVDVSGSGKGIEALVEGKLAIAGVSRSLKADERKQKLLGTIIGYDAIAIFVHADNPVTNLSKEQLKGIFSGAVTNWKEVGGVDAPIAPSIGVLTSKRGTVEMFHAIVLDGSLYGSGFKEIDLPGEQIADLAADPNGICGVSLGLFAAVPAAQRARVKAITVNSIEPTEEHVQSGAYLISRPLLLVTRGLPDPQAKQFIRFMLSPAGQEIVARNFVPVRK